jgi:hypothetical protein
VEIVRDFSVLFEYGGLSIFALQSSHKSTLWYLFVSEGGGSRNSCLVGGEFEFFVEIVNLVPARTLEF